MITHPSVNILEDVAQELGIDDPSLVEKDFFTVKALSICATIKSALFLLVFAGGTCLSKTYKAVERMSEDVDIKIIRTDAGNRLSRTALKKSLKSIRHEILNALKSEGLLVPSENVKSRNEYHYTELKIPYPQQFVSSVALRPEIKLDLTLSTFLSPPITKPVSSFVADMFGKQPEVAGIHCVRIEDMAAEKLVSLTRRTAAVLCGRLGMDDETLVRHIFDLCAVENVLEGNVHFSEMVQRVVAIDIEQFGNQVPEYRENPRRETAKALRALSELPQYAQRYNNFLGPLVYTTNPPSWEDALGSIYRIAKQVWGDDILPK